MKIHKYEHFFELEADTVTDAIRELDGYKILPICPSHNLISCDQEHIGALVQSMSEHGWVGDPVVFTDYADGVPVLVDGRHRCIAAALAGIPVQAIELPWLQYLELEDEYELYQCAEIQLAKFKSQG